MVNIPLIEYRNYLLYLPRGLSVVCLFYITFLVVFYLKKEKIQPRNWSSIIGWVVLIIGISFILTIMIAAMAMGDDGVPFTFLTVLFLTLDLTSAIYLIIKLSYSLFLDKNSSFYRIKYKK